MRTLMVTDGTRACVRAMVALGCGLIKRGHKPVLVACPARFRALVEDYGLRWTHFDPVPPSPKRDFPAFADSLEEVCRREGINQTRDSTATQQRTCIVCEYSSLTVAYSLAEKYAVCWVGVFFAPVSPTHAYPSTAFTSSASNDASILRLPILGRSVSIPHRNWMNKWSHLLAMALEWKWSTGAKTNEWRKNKLQLPIIPNALGVLPLIKKQILPVIYPLHPSFFSKPDDWPAELKVPAFIFLPDKPAPAPFLSSDLRLELAAKKDDEPEFGSWDKKENESEIEEAERLQRFIKSEEGDAKSKPILFACGGLISTSVSASAVIKIASQLAENTRNQVIMFIRDEDGSAKQQPDQIQDEPAENHLQQATSSEDGDGLVDVHPEWAKLIYSPGTLPESLCVISRLSYSSLLPKCSCAIIDGGHGIVAASIRAGVPFLCVPSDGDRVSWFWANRSFEMGISAAPIPRADLNAGVLLKAIDRATSAQTVQKLQNLSKKVNLDGDGVRKVVDAFERVCITSIGIVPTSDFAGLSTLSAIGQELSAREKGLAAAVVVVTLLMLWLLLKVVFMIF